MLTAQIMQVLTGLFAILGHNYSPWVGFKGGKGIATSAWVPHADSWAIPEPNRST